MINVVFPDNFAIKSIEGMVYNPVSGNWNWTRCTANNYALVAVKRSEKQ